MFNWDWIGTVEALIMEDHCQRCTENEYYTFITTDSVTAKSRVKFDRENVLEYIEVQKLTKPSSYSSEINNRDFY